MTKNNLLKLSSDSTLPENTITKISSVYTWSDLILPKKQKDKLLEISAHLKQILRIHNDPKFELKNKNTGITALFMGEKGTGKTMAAEVLANELNLDLYRIDLSEVVSKYIGETEKNLKRIFDAAEDGGAILLFDEADALFGKRSEVKDSHDRYANIEINYLLQKMEAYHGLAILTTNIKSAMEKAFLRRIRYVVHFPFPDAAQREKIWSNIFPSKSQKTFFDYKKLAKFNFTGGNIRNIRENVTKLESEKKDDTIKFIKKSIYQEYRLMRKPISRSDLDELE